MKLLDDLNLKIMLYIWKHPFGCTKESIQNGTKIFGFKRRRTKKIVSRLSELEGFGYIKKEYKSEACLYTAIIEETTYNKMFAYIPFGYETYSEEDKKRIRKAIELLDNSESENDF